MLGELGCGLVKCGRGACPFKFRAYELQGMTTHRPASTSKNDCLLTIYTGLPTGDYRRLRTILI
jgi:hypothetical protein